MSMSMTQRDWYDYLDFMRSEIKGSDLKNPKSIGEAYNNHVAMRDITDVTENKLKRYVKSEKNPPQAQA